MNQESFEHQRLKAVANSKGGSRNSIPNQTPPVLPFPVFEKRRTETQLFEPFTSHSRLSNSGVTITTATAARFHEVMSIDAENPLFGCVVGDTQIPSPFRQSNSQLEFTNFQSH